jgi:YD repeat-containing protein
LDGDDAVTGSWSPSNPGQMVLVSSNLYDAGGVGDGNLTQTTDYTSNTASRVTQNAYDWRDRLVMTKEGGLGSSGDGTHRPILYYRYDNQDEVVETDRYDGDGISIPSSNPVPPSDSLLVAKATTEYDDDGRVFRTRVFNADPNVPVANWTSLITSTWYDKRGHVIATVTPGGLVTKTAYDGDGRVAATYTTDGGGPIFDNSSKLTVAGDVVLEQINYSYGVTFAEPDVTVSRQRDHDATGPGDLSAVGAPLPREVPGRLPWLHPL